MRVGSTFSGVGGFDLGFERAGMSVVWQAEIDEWSRRVLRWHWPDAAIFNDVRSVNREAGGVDLLCGGFPCQDLSVAGKRAGFKGERSSLFFEFARIADDLKPRWIVLENVAGLLSSAEGRDFGILLSTLAELGYGCAWRLVDARFFGVPQRRRRVFIVGCLGDNGEQAVRALGAGGEGDLKASACSWQGPSVGASRSVRSASEMITQATGFHPTQTPISEHEGSPALGVTSGGMAVGIAPTISFQLGNTKANGSNVNTEGVAYTLDRAAGQGVLTDTLGTEVSKPLLSHAGRTTDLDGGAYVRYRGSSVRRLTPVECERLMSWPDGWTAVDGEETPDGRRYAACGNGVVANVSEWIGRRIMTIEEEKNV